MRVHLINPSDVAFGVGVIVPRWLYVLGGATPRSFEDPIIVDETVRATDFESIRGGDVVGIGIHTSNARAGYRVGLEARKRGAWIVYGGIHATLFPDEPRERGGAHAVVRGDGDRVWATALEDCRRGEPRAVYDGGKVEDEGFARARWDLLPDKSYMWASVQTVRGCPKHCSFCSVWRTDGQTTRFHPIDTVVEEIVELRRVGFRFIALADDNFYPVTLHDIAAAARRNDPTRVARVTALRQQRLDLLERLAQLPEDTIFFTQITMEAADDAELLDAMRRANVKGALVGVESVTAAGLKDVYKGFNASGEALVERLQRFRRAGIHVLGSFIFGLPSDTAATFDATADLANRAGLTFAQFVPLTPFPGTIDFGRWEAGFGDAPPLIDGVPVTRHWLIEGHHRPKLYSTHPTMSVDEVRERTQKVWDDFYSLSKVWRRARCVKAIRSRLAFVLISKLYRQMYAKTGIATDSARVDSAARWARLIARPCRRLFMGRPMPDLQAPQPRQTPAAVLP